jgi:undecaprenyl-diphosphatase
MTLPGPSKEIFDLDFLDRLIQVDKELLVYINGLGNENWDGFWLIITNQFTWIPLYLVFFYLIFKSLGWKKGLVLVILAAALVTFSDQFTVFLKNSFERLRPNRDPAINEIIRIVKNNKSFSFVSGHATTSMAVTVFMHLILKKHYRFTILFFIWPVLFAFSRVYIGVHFPLDVIMGALLGVVIGVAFYKLSMFIFGKMDRTS